MWECKNASEKADLKLIAIRFVLNIWKIIVAAIVGAVVIGGIYYLVNITFAGKPDYKSVSEYYIDFAVNESGEEYTYFNEVTWEDLIDTDVFVDTIMDNMSTNIEKETLKEYMSATILSDTRIVTATVVTPDPELTMDISIAMEKAFTKFGQEQKEAEEIRMLSAPTAAAAVIPDVRPVRATLLGALAGVILMILGMLLACILDDSIYVPITFENRYHIPMIGTIEDSVSGINTVSLTKEGSHFVCMGVTGGKQEEERMECAAKALDCRIKEAYSEKTISYQPCIMEHPEILPMVQDADGIILSILAGAHNGTRIEAAISELHKLQAKVIAAVLINPDWKTMRAYYGFKIRKK